MNRGCGAPTPSNLRSLTHSEVPFAGSIIAARIGMSGCEWRNGGVTILMA